MSDITVYTDCASAGLQTILDMDGHQPQDRRLSKLQVRLVGIMKEIRLSFMIPQTDESSWQTFHAIYHVTPLHKHCM